MCQFGDDAWQHRNTEFMKLMCDAIVCHCIDYRIAEYDLAIICCSGIVVEHGFHIGIKQSFHVWHAIDIMQSELHRSLWNNCLVLVAIEEHAACYLFLQQREQFLH